MTLTSRVARLEAAVEARRPAVLFMVEEGDGQVRTSASTGTLTPEEAVAAERSSGARLVFRITSPPVDPTPGPTFEELMAENEAVARDAARDVAAEAPEPDPPESPEPPPEQEVDPVKARELVMEMLRRAVSGRDMSDLDLESVYRASPDDLEPSDEGPPPDGPDG